MSADRLAPIHRNVLDRVRAAAVMLDHDRAERDYYIRQAAELRVPVRTIASYALLSFSQVARIAKGGTDGR